MINPMGEERINQKISIFFQKNQKGAMEISFGMIFSIILIIIFISFAIYGITKFLNLQKEVQIESFVEQFENDVNKVWISTQTSQSFTYSLPANIAEVCFAERVSGGDSIIEMEIKKSGQNIGQKRKIEKIDFAEDKLCIKSSDGKIKINLKKDVGDALVELSAA